VEEEVGGTLPKVFTEQGVAMLSSVLNSERAIEGKCRHVTRYGAMIVL